MKLPGTRRQRQRALAWFIFLLYFAIALKVVLFKYPRSVLYMWPLAERVELANFIPFRTIAFYLGGNESTGVALRNLAGNILVFVPMGFMLPMVLRKLQRMRYILTCSFVVSLSLEVVQLLTGLGGFDADDLLLNVLGAAIGGLVYGGARKVRGRLQRSGS